VAPRPIAPNALWALDFQFDTTDDDKTIKMLNVIDEYTRECLAIVVERSIDDELVVATLDRLALERQAAGFVRFDNGPEFVAHAVADWCRFIIEDWRIDYNKNRPHSAHGELTPEEFAATWAGKHQPVLA